MPLSQDFQTRRAHGSRSVSRPGSAGSQKANSRAARSRSNTPTRESSKRIINSTTPPVGSYNGRISPTETRQELIERKKREQRAWLLEGTGPYSKPSPRRTPDLDNKSPERSVLLPPPDIEVPTRGQEEHVRHERTEAATEIERPRSALHRGDFRQDDQQTVSTGLQPGSPYPHTRVRRSEWQSTSPTSPWYRPHLPHIPSLRASETFAGFEARPQTTIRPSRQRAASYTSRSLSLALQPPTSPLVNQTNNNSSDSENDNARAGRPISPDKASRRRTFSPGALRSIRPPALSHESSPAIPRALPNVRRDGVMPYQAHQPRRSITSSHEPSPYSVPHTPSAHSRRPSIVSESSPLQRAPMVGRYEESILRGRMSSHPSRPLDFVAQIGVLGWGKCKSHLRCPPHVSVPFPAVFYHYGSRPGSPNKSEDGPSPYVGMVDMNSVELSQVPSHGKSSSSAEQYSAGFSDPDRHAMECNPSTNARKRTHSGRRRLKPYHAGLAGGYRIPEKGQLQIIIKNPNKTAVKLFLVPYDLEGMEPGQKTFIRQRSYSAGPIIDMPLCSRKNLGTDRPEAALSNAEDPEDRPVLRYLIHLNICCPTKGRFYLFKSIRIVFANRVPDGKEKLRQEIQLPEPRFSPWKPDLEGTSSSKSETAPIMRKSRYDPLRRSYDSSMAHSGPPSDQKNGFPMPSGPSSQQDWCSFTFPEQKPLPVLPSSRPMSGDSNNANTGTPPSPLSKWNVHTGIRTCGTASPTYESPSRTSFQRLDWSHYSGPDSRPLSPRPGEGLLSQQFRGSATSRPSSQG